MRKILLCLDSDPQPSVFDGVVAVDAGADHLFRHGGVQPADVQALVHGAMFTRGGDDLKHTAVFVGGSDIAAGERLLEAVTKSFFGPVRVSAMLDSNGSNTTAAAAVVAAGRHLDLGSSTTAVVLGTGAVGLRAALMLAAEGVRVRLASRTQERAAAACATLADKGLAGAVEPFSSSADALAATLGGAQALISAGPAGVTMVDEATRSAAGSLRVAIDLNAVPPLGLAGIEVTDKAAERNGQTCYGALGVGGLKMKIHKAALQSLFERNDALLDAAEIYAVGKSLG
ncbi:MAG: NAD(P)-dependent methylenetetrahydromethanopterin dehydrogenase [Planctomycetota bacterium]